MKLLSMEELRAKVKEHYEIYDTNYERLAKRMGTSDRTLRKFLQIESSIGLDTYIKMHNYILKLEEEAQPEVKKEVVKQVIKKEKIEKKNIEEFIEYIKERLLLEYGIDLKIVMYSPSTKTIYSTENFSNRTLMTIQTSGDTMVYI